MSDSPKASVAARSAVNAPTYAITSMTQGTARKSG